jgi:prolipoprotein diacylglyceryltransferase
MRLTVYLLFILLFVLAMSTLRICVRDYRRTRNSGTFKPYFYLLGILLSVALLVLGVIGVFFAVVGPLH